MIVFVGDKPSNKNLHLDVPFVGTQSYKVLLMWIWEMDLDINKIAIVNKNNVNYYDSRHTFIALGTEAAKTLNYLGYIYHKLPHPSPRNRLLNDKKYVMVELQKCKEYIKTQGEL